MTSATPIAVTGATGFVGQALLDAAARDQLPVRALTRRDQPERAGVTWVRGDLHHEPALRRLGEGASAFVHVAGVVNAPDAAGFARGNVEGTRNAVEAARAAGARRFVHVSSLAAREPHLSDYGHSKRMAEEIVQVSGLDWIIVRPPAIYGPRDTEMLELFRMAKRRVVPMPPPGRASVINVDDLARLLLAFARRPIAESGAGMPDTAHRVFEPDDGRAGGWAHRELAHAIGDAVGKRVWAPAMPARLLRAAARADRALRRGKAKLTPDRARYMAHPDWVSDPEKAVDPALWQPAIATAQGLADTARWYRAAGWL